MFFIITPTEKKNKLSTYKPGPHVLVFTHVLTILSVFYI